MTAATVCEVRTKLRTVETDTPCPKCGRKLGMRQVGHMVEELPEPVKWTDDGHICRRGCLLTADDLR